MRFPIKILVLLLLLSVYNKSKAQDTSTLITALSQNNNFENPTFVVLLYTNDCFKCKLPLNGAVAMLKTIDTNRKYKRIIYSDNYAYALKFNKDEKVNAQVIYNKDIFNYIPQNLKSGVVVIGCGSATDISAKDMSLKDVKQLLINTLVCTTKPKKLTTWLEFRDSLMDIKNMFSTAASDYGFAIFDNLMQQGIIINTNKEVQYKNATLSDSIIIQTLPDRVNKQRFSLLPYAIMQPLLQRTGIAMLHINTINAYNQKAYCIFSLNRLYKDNAAPDAQGVFTTMYIAVKNITNTNNWQNIYNIDTYNKIFYIDTFQFKDTTYSFGGWGAFRPIFMNDSTIQINVNKNLSSTKSEFGGLATVVLQSNGKPKMIALNTNVEKVINIENKVTFNNKQYYISKRVTDSTTNTGNIIIEEQKN